jgi:ABC-type nitrate/sulfonate/bicarbonate transport system permease component
VLQSQQSFAIPQMWAGTLLLGLLGYSLNAGFGVFERRVLRWHVSQRTEN